MIQFEKYLSDDFDGRLQARTEQFYDERSLVWKAEQSIVDSGERGTLVLCTDGNITNEVKYEYNAYALLDKEIQGARTSRPQNIDADETSALPGVIVS